MIRYDSLIFYLLFFVTIIIVVNWYIDVINVYIRLVSVIRICLTGIVFT